MDEDSGLEIQVIDSNTTQAALGFIVIEAALAARANRAMFEIIEVIKMMKPKAKYLMAMDSISPLQRIGPCSLPEKSRMGFTHKTDSRDGYRSG